MPPSWPRIARGSRSPPPCTSNAIIWYPWPSWRRSLSPVWPKGAPRSSPTGKTRGIHGAQRAGRFQRGVILKLLVRVPLRQRNVREMQLDRHLWKDTTTGHWHLEFAGDDLKIGSRGPEVNRYELNLSTYRPEFIPILEEWLTVHRPKLPNAATSPFVFLTQRGNPHISKTLHGDLSDAVAMRTGKRFYPHIVRTMWATEYLKETQDFQTAATMLGDQLRTVIATYYDVVHREQHPQSQRFSGQEAAHGLSGAREWRKWT